MDTLHNMPRYPAYKNSGVEWLGEIPEGWELKPGFVSFSENKRTNKGMIEDTVLSLSYGKIIIKPKKKLVGLVPESFETYQLVEPGDIIIRCIDLQNDKTSLRTGLAKDKGIITSAYLNLNVSSYFDSKYLHYYLHSLDTVKVLYKFGSGLRQNLSFQDFKYLPVFFMPLPEQQAIANFLNEKTGKIDEAIAIKQQQIELLKERKQIIIQNAVTRGLNPDAPLRDSGIDWIGKIPEHWEVKKTKHFGRISSGDAIVNNELEDTGLYEVFGGNGVMGYANKFNVRGENIIIGRVGALCGNIRYINEKKWVSDNALIYKLYQGLNYQYFSLLFEVANFNKLNVSNAQPLITGTKIMNFSLPIPPKKEQNEIFKFIDGVSKSMSKAITLQQQQIDRLKEYKTTLINSAVTGKIQVPLAEVHEK